MKDKVTVQSQERPSWTLRRAVLIYEAEQSSFEERDQRMYATLHKVRRGQRGAELDAGEPATREACADIARALGANASLGGFVPPNLLYLGAKSILWWRPPAEARVFFNTTKAVAGDQLVDPEGANLIGRKNGLTAQPGLVFGIATGRWYVYAVAGADRPKPSTPLLRSPYFNVWASGQICTGNVRLPDTLSAQALDVYERAFFDSEFTHPNLRGKARLTRHKDGAYGLWHDLLGRPKGKPFPDETLVGLKLNLQDLAKRLEKDGRVAPDDD